MPDFSYLNNNADEELLDEDSNSAKPSDSDKQSEKKEESKKQPKEKDETDDDYFSDFDPLAREEADSIQEGSYPDPDDDLNELPPPEPSDEDDEPDDIHASNEDYAEPEENHYESEEEEEKPPAKYDEEEFKEHSPFSNDENEDEKVEIVEDDPPSKAEEPLSKEAMEREKSYTDVHGSIENDTYYKHCVSESEPVNKRSKNMSFTGIALASFEAYQQGEDSDDNYEGNTDYSENDTLGDSSKPSFDDPLKTQIIAEKAVEPQLFSSENIGNITLKKRIKETERRMKAPEAPLRKYDVKTVYPKPRYVSPVDSDASFGKQFLMFSSLSVIVGLIFGFQANSYYNSIDDPDATAFSVMFAWLSDSSAEFTIFPFNVGIFMASFLTIGIVMSLIILFILLDAEQKKKRRIGHEHGNAKLGTKKTFKEYQAKFMD